VDDPQVHGEERGLHQSIRAHQNRQRETQLEPELAPRTVPKQDARQHHRQQDRAAHQLRRERLGKRRDAESGDPLPVSVQDKGSDDRAEDEVKDGKGQSGRHQPPTPAQAAERRHRGPIGRKALRPAGKNRGGQHGGNHAHASQRDACERLNRAAEDYGFDGRVHADADEQQCAQRQSGGLESAAQAGGGRRRAGGQQKARQYKPREAFGRAGVLRKRR